ncbi:hypothetical protein DRP04_15365 [Archaeoglobales archaeon]|mgnify:CR=1 FL=1|nr:MAG: hypothetical protein DRP04_15365 [Archaeoglobales archaeon]
MLVEISLYDYEDEARILLEVDDVNKFLKKLKEIATVYVRRLLLGGRDQFIDLYDIAEAIRRGLKENGFKLVFPLRVAFNVPYLPMKPKSSESIKEEIGDLDKLLSNEVLVKLLEHNRKIEREIMNELGDS